MRERKSTNAVWLTLGFLGGCSALFGIDDPERRELPGPRGGGSGGGAGSAEPSGGSGAGGAGQAGEGGNPSTGGAAGTATAGSGELGGSGGAAGLSGAGGDGGADDDGFEKEDAACSTPGAFACVGTARDDRLICRGGVWTAADCDNSNGVQRNCDRRSGACAVVVSGCSNSPNFAVCEDENVAISCGPDLVSYEVQNCTFGCDAGKCLPQGADQLIVDRTPRTDQDFVYWQSPVIPVCLDAGSEDGSSIRDEVDGTWGRYASITFPGWGDCSHPVPESGEVRISFDDDCPGELGGVSEYGYPGPFRRVEMRICASYLDASRVPHTAEDPMRRFVARHLFGHVLGLAHDSRYFMTQVIRASELDDLPFDSETIKELQVAHGTKPRGSLVNASGRCIAVQGEELVTAACDGSPATRWQALGGQLWTEQEKCLGASGDAAAAVSGCANDPEFAWETTAVRWQAQANRCVAINTGVGSSLVTEDCRAFGDANQTWSFEFVGNGRVRIHLSNSGDCVRAPAPGAEPLAPPELGSCGLRDEFETTEDGQLEFSGYCMVEDLEENSQYEVHFKPCLASAKQAFYLSGAFTHGSGTVLTLSDGLLRATRLVGAPTSSQIFDYHF